MALSKSGSKKPTGKIQMASAREWASKMAEGGKSDFSCLKLPDGFEFYTMEEEGVHELDILPYVVGKGNRFADEGFGHYAREYHSHRVPSSNGRSKVVACARECFGKPCAVCDWLDKHSQTADKKLVDGLKGKVRFLFNVVDRKEKGRPIRVWDTHYYNRKMGTGELIKEAMDTLPEGVEPFGLEDGYTLFIKSTEDSFQGNKFQKVTRVDLRPRKEDYPEDTIHKTACLDECIVEPDYKAIKSLLQRGEDSEDDDNEKHERDADETFGPRDSGKKPKQRDPDPEEDEDEEQEEEETSETADDLGIEKGMTVKYKGKLCKVVKISGDGSSLSLKDDEDNVRSGIAPNLVTIVEEDEEEEEEEEEEENPPKKKGGSGKSTSKKPSTKDSEEENEDDDWDDDDD